MSNRRGSLTIAGSGIMSIGQLTLEAVAAIENADIVCYVLNDPLTEAYVRKKNPNVYDLYQLYDDEKPRLETYIQMVEVMVSKVRDGQNVVGLFYGHPGVFVNPSHEAIKLARREGYRARMLPGISAEDCLYADLGIDPCLSGTQTYEATDLIEGKRDLNINNNVILWQVGVVGNQDFNFRRMENPRFDKLVNRLEEAYGSEQEVTHYIAASLAIKEPVMEKIKISDLKKDDVKRKIIAASTFYIPPVQPPQRSLQESTDEKVRRAAISALANHQPGKNYPKSKDRPALVEVLERLSLEPRALEDFKADRRGWVDANGRALDEEEKNALITGQNASQLLRDIPLGENMEPVGHFGLTIIVVIVA